MSSWLWPPKPSHKTEGWQGVSATTEGESVQASWWMDWHKAWGTPAGHQWDNENLTSQRSWRLEETSLQEETRRGQKWCERMLSSHQGNVNETPEWYLVRRLLHGRTRGSCCKLLEGDQRWVLLKTCHLSSGFPAKERADVTQKSHPWILIWKKWNQVCVGFSVPVCSQLTTTEIPLMEE